MAEPLDRPAPTGPPPQGAPEDLSARLIAALEEHGILELVVSVVEQSDELVAILVRELSRESRVQGVRNAFVLMGMLGRLPAEDLVGVLSEDPPRRLGLVELWRRFRTPAARRGMYRLSRMLEALGSDKSPGP